jgi:excisionase family DNA binding protein
MDGINDLERTDRREGPAWGAPLRRHERDLCEALDFAALTPDISFVAFLKTFSQFGFFRFGPITIDVEVVEDILLRTHPRGEGGPEFPMSSEASARAGELGWKLLRNSGRQTVGERELLMAYLHWGEGLPARVFGELGISVADVERYIAEASAPLAHQRAGAGRLFSTDEAAEYLGVHVQTIRSWIRSGKLPAARLAGMKSIRIRESDLEAVLEPIEPADAEINQE